MTFGVIGAAGFIGRHLVPHLSALDRGNVLCLTRSPHAFPGAKNAMAIAGDMRDPTALEKIAARGGIVINLAFAPELSAPDQLTAANSLANVCAAASVRRLIHVSTAAVAGRASAPWIDENTRCLPATAYERIKFEIEKVLLDSQRGPDIVILRPTAVFGGGGHNLVKLAAEIAGGEKFRGYLRVCFHGRRAMNLVSVENVAAAISHLALLPGELSGRIFNVADDDAAANNYEAVEARLRRAFGRVPRSLPVLRLPPPLQRIALRLAGRASIYPQRRYSCSKLLSTGFKRPLDFETALDRYAAYLAQQFAQCGEIRG